MNIRKVVSLTLFLSFIFLGLTGIMLFICPHGRIAYWSGWEMFGFSKEQYGEIHTTFMILFLVTGIWHTVLNWKPIANYLKDKSKRLRIFTPEFVVALLLSIFFFVGTLTGIVPFRQYLDAGEKIKDHWIGVYGEPPWGHAELNTVERFCRGLVDYERMENRNPVSIDVDDALAALRNAGIVVGSSEERLIDIADANGTTPSCLSVIISTAIKPVEGVDDTARLDSLMPYPVPRSGLGRMTFRQYTKKYKVDLEHALTLMRDADREIDPDARLKDEAARVGTDPAGLIEFLNECAR